MCRSVAYLQLMGLLLALAPGMAGAQAGEAAAAAPSAAVTGVSPADQPAARPRRVILPMQGETLRQCVEQEDAVQRLMRNQRGRRESLELHQQETLEENDRLLALQKKAKSLSKPAFNEMNARINRLNQRIRLENRLAEEVTAEQQSANLAVGEFNSQCGGRPFDQAEWDAVVAERKVRLAPRTAPLKIGAAPAPAAGASAER